MSVELVWRSPVDHATTVSAGILSRVKQGGAIRADDMDHKTERAGRAVCHILASAR